MCGMSDVVCIAKCVRGGSDVVACGVYWSIFEEELVVGDGSWGAVMIDMVTLVWNYDS